MGSLDLTFFFFKVFQISSIYLKVRASIPIILFANVHLIFNMIFFQEVFLINCIFCKIWLDGVELTEMPTASAWGANTEIGIVMAEIQVMKLTGCFSKILVEFAFLIFYEEWLGSILIYGTSINFCFWLILNIHCWAIVSSWFVLCLELGSLVSALAPRLWSRPLAEWHLQSIIVLKLLF